MITCDECGRENDDDYKFCLGCGSSLEGADTEDDQDTGAEMINCPYCGAEQPQNFRFCGSCGEQIPDGSPDESGVGEQSAPEDRSTAPGKPGVDNASPKPSTADQSTPGQSKPGQSSPGQSKPGQSKPGPGGVAPSEPAESKPGTGAAAGSSPSQSSSEKGAGNTVQRDPSVDTPARLVVIRPDGTEGATIDVPKDKMTLGRASDLEALSSDPFLSPTHASINFRDGDFVVQDEDSLNGIFREVTDSTDLQDGDFVRVGQELLRFETFDDEPHPDEDAEILTGGSPDGDYWGRLRLIAGPGIETKAYALGEPEVTIGRESGEILFQEDGFVSGTHAQLAGEDGTPVLRDLNSSNGTFIRIRGEHKLADGERVLMGQQLFRLEVD